MALTTEEKKKTAQTAATAPATTTAAQTTAPSTTPAPAAGYQSQYKSKIEDLTKQLSSRPAFEYNASEDQLWQQYLDKYQQGGKLAMKDTMGQAAALTGGYGSSYGQAVGQQAYNAYMQEAADILPTLEAQAWERYNAEGDRLAQQLGILQDADATDYGRYIDDRNYQQELENTAYSRYTYDKEWAWQQEQANKENLQNMIASTGYTPTAEELAAAGMTEAEAQALKQGLVAGDPDYAYRMGLIDGEQYKAMTGVYPAGYTPASSGGGGGDYYYGGGDEPEVDPKAQLEKDIQNAPNRTEKYNLIQKAVVTGVITPEEAHYAEINARVR